MGEARRVHYQPVIDQFWSIPILTPPFLWLFAAAFVAATLATARRPSYGVAFLVLTVPFDLMHAIGGTTVSLPKAVLLGVIAGLLSTPSAWRALRAPAPSSITLAFGIALAALALSGVSAEHRTAVTREILKWIEYFGYFAAAYVAYVADPDDGLIVRAFSASFALTCASALSQEITGAPWGIYLGHGIAPRISGALEGPNQLAAYLGTAIATLGSWNAAMRSKITGAVLGLCAFTLLLTFSRGGFAGALIAVVVVAAYQRSTWMRALRPLFAGTLAGILGDVAWSLFAARSLASLTLTPQSGAYAGGVGNRAELWRAALLFFREHPLLGIGAGNYELELERAGVFGVRTHANSWYLQALAEGGLVGLLAVLAFLFLVVRALIARAASSPWAVAALAATAGLAIHQIADYLVFYPKVAEPWIILIALGVAPPLPARSAS